MKLYATVLLLAVALAGCSKKDTSPTPKVAATTAASAPEMAIVGREWRVLALGDSLFAGYGVRPAESYPSRLEAALRAHGVNARVANAGVSGDTTAGGRERLEFTLKSQTTPPDLAIISLGGNDMLRGLPPEQTRANLESIVSELRKRKIRVLLMGMLAPPNMGQEYRSKFDPIYSELAEKQGVSLVPFFLKAVIDKPDLVQADHIHPTAKGIEEIVAATVYAVEGELVERPDL